jgi:type II secretory pathway component PulF
VYQIASKEVFFKQKLLIMTNAQINLEVAVKALEAGKLNGSAKSFIESIRDHSKQDLRKLTSKQYKFLNDIYNQHKDDL